MSTFGIGVSFLTALVYLGLAVVAVFSRNRGPLTPTFGRTTAALFAYETFELLKQTTDNPVFDDLECAAASLVAPTTAALVITFIGAWRSLRWLVIAGASYFSLLSLLCLLATVVPSLQAFSAEAPWALAMLLGLVPEFGYLAVRLYRHARSADASERARTQLLVLALVLGLGGAMSDLMSIAGADTPRVAFVALLVAALVLGVLALRMDLLDNVRGLVVANVLVVAIAAVVFFDLAFTVGEGLFGELAAPSLLAAPIAVSISLAAMATVRPILAMQAEERARLRQLATLGRFSAQMAHDLKNPLAAIRGAAQYLLEERKQGRSIDEADAFLTLVLEQTDRATRVVDDYQRLGRAEAVKMPVDVDAMILELVTAQRAASPAHPITLDGEGVGEIALDRDLVLGALENLIRNAREAMPEGGAMVVGKHVLGRRLQLSVTDRGPGMDPRAREQAFDDFFTTKATGSGLGLAFVSRVAEAHGGKASLRSELGVGTKVTLDLPL